MTTRLAVNEQNQMQEIRENQFPTQPMAIRIIAKVVSYIFHPVFVPLYVIGFMVYIHPYLFAGLSDFDKLKIFIQSFVNFTFFPLVTVLLLKGLNFIDSIYLRTQRDRIIPFIACMIWYFWIWYVWNNYGKTTGLDIPVVAVQFALATFISTIIGLMVNIKIKVSLHAISMGIMIAFMLMLAFQQDLNFGIYISIALLIAGLVCTARFIVSDHTSAEVYGGLVVGILSMLIAGWVG